MNTFHQTYARLHRFTVDGWLWLRQADLISLFVLSLGAGVVWLIAVPTKDCLKLVEVALNVAGTVLAVKGLFGVRLSLGLPPVRTLITAWWADRPRWHPNINIAIGTGGVSMGGSSVAGFSRADIADDATLDVQVAWLRQQVVQLATGQSRLEKQTTELDRQIRHHDEKQTTALAALETEWRQKTIALHAGGFGETLLGLIWIVLASVVSALELWSVFA